MIDGQLFKDCDLNLTVDPTADSLCRQNAATLRSCSGCRWGGNSSIFRKKEAHTATQTCPVSDLPKTLIWPDQLYTKTCTVSLGGRVFISSGGLVYWNTVSRDIISKRHLHYSSSCSSTRTKHGPAVLLLPRSRFPMRTTRLLAAILLFMTPLHCEDRQRQLQPQHLTEHHRRCLFVFYRREPCSPVANVKHFPIKADSYYHCLVCVSRQPFTFSAPQVWGRGHIMQSSQPLISVEIEPRAKKMHLRHKMTSEFHSAVQPD